VENSFGHKDYYKELEIKVSRGQYLRIIRKFNMMVRNQIALEGFEWNMFESFGKMAVYKYRPTIRKREDNTLSLPINWKETSKLWKEKPELKDTKFVYHLNQNTDGYICKIFWVKFSGFAAVKNQNYVFFKRVDEFRKIVSHAIRYNHADRNYFIFSNFNNER